MSMIGKAKQYTQKHKKSSKSNYYKIKNFSTSNTPCIGQKTSHREY